MTTQRLMKDGLDQNAVNRISEALHASWAPFPKHAFQCATMDGLDALELKDRVRHLIAIMKRFLPADFEKTADILIGTKAHWNPGDPADNLAGFAAWPIIDYIGTHGLEHPKTSLAALKKLTSMFSAEFAIRPYLIHHTGFTLAEITRWTDDPDEHVRRLVSEGTRPRLPWGQQLPAFIRDPAPTRPLLEALKDDPSEYVRRSVANHLNDISKDHPETVIHLCEKWKKGAGKNREKIIRHASRTLVKAGHPAVFGLLGYTENPKLELQALDVSPREIKLGESIVFSFQLQSTRSKPQTVVIDYAIHHMKTNGQTTPKVFKFKSITLAGGEAVDLTKKHVIKPITTRKYHAGEHAVEILINGKTFGRVPFTLCVT